MAVRFGLAVVALLILSGCSTMKPEDFAHTQPRFALEDYFAGRTTAWGMFVDRFGKVRSQFVVDIDGTWDGTTLTLDERFTYATGERDRRVWKITKQDANTYTGTAGDVIGVARGRSFGNALNWTYRMNLKVGDGTWKVQFDDWMFLQPQGVMLNRAVVSKWGIELGQVQLAFRKAEARVAQDNTPQQQAAE